MKKLPVRLPLLFIATFALWLVGALSTVNTALSSSLTSHEQPGTLLECLPKCGVCSTEWLVWTNDWLVPWVAGKSMYEVGDLLAAFIRALEERASKGIIEHDATYDRAVVYVQYLIQTRESLTASDAASMPTTGTDL